MSNTDRDSITGRQLTPEGKKMDYSTKETEEININSVIQKRKKEQIKSNHKVKKMKFILMG